MKYLLITLWFGTAFICKAQTITQEQLQGSWRMVGYEGPDFKLNYDTEEYFTEIDIEKRYAPQDLQVLLEDLVRMLQAGKDNYLVFEGGMATKRNKGIAEDRNEVRLYADDEGHNICSFVYSQGWNEPAISKDFMVFIENNTLYLTEDNVQIKHIYEKEP